MIHRVTAHGDELDEWDKELRSQQDNEVEEVK